MNFISFFCDSNYFFQAKIGMIYARKVSESFRKVIKIKIAIVNNYQNDIYLQFGNVDSYQDLLTKY